MRAMNHIYGLADPRDGIIRYIGKSKNLRRRMARHMSAMNLEKKHHAAAWLRSIVVAGLSPSVIVVESLNDADDWAAREIFWIAHFRSLGHDMTNFTDGGDGGATFGRKGKKNTPEHIRKSSRPGVPVKHTAEGSKNRAQGVRNYYKRMRDAGISIIGTPCSELRKQRIGNSNRGRIMPMTQSRLDAIERSRGRPSHNRGCSMSEETKRKISAAKKGKPWTDARRLAK